MHILLVEDNIKFRNTVKQVLQSKICEEIRIIESDSGKEAVKLYKKFRPDWILMDINIEEQDGLSAAGEILAFDSNAKIIILTMYHDHEFIQISNVMGVQNFVLKEDLLIVPDLLQ